MARLEFDQERSAVGPASVAVGALVWRTKDPQLEARLRRSYDGLPASERRSLPVAVAVSGRLGTPLTVRVSGPADSVLGPADPVLGSANLAPEGLSGAAAGGSAGEEGSGGARVSVEVESGVVLAPADRRALDEDSVRDMIGQLGDNSLSVESLDLSGLDLSAGDALLGSKPPY